MEGEAVDPRRVILSHMDKRPDLGLHSRTRLLAATCSSTTRSCDRSTGLRRTSGRSWVERSTPGWSGPSRACGLDLADPTMWRFAGGPYGMSGLVSVVEKGLRGLGADEAARRALLRNNILERVALASPT